MNFFWSYFWPVLAAGIVFGVIAGTFGFRLKITRTRGAETSFVRPPLRVRWFSLLAGIAASIIFAALWHGPFGAAQRFEVQVERQAREGLDNWEMYKVSASLHHDPLTRRLVLTGPADDFQRSELAKIMGTISGVSSVRWSAKQPGLPLIAEGAAAGCLGFLFGLLLAYLVERRRRYNAQWSW